MPKCMDCNFHKNETNFYTRIDKRGDTPRIVLLPRCKPCHNKWQKEYKKRTGKGTEYNKKKKKDRTERKIRAIQYKGGKCVHCNQSVHLAAFDFHHTNPKEKDTDPGLMMQLKDEILFKELDKCILLCANCHRIEHYEN